MHPRCLQMRRSCKRHSGGNNLCEPHCQWHPLSADQVHLEADAKSHCSQSFMQLVYLTFWGFALLLITARVLRAANLHVWCYRCHVVAGSFKREIPQAVEALHAQTHFTRCTVTVAEKHL